MFLRHNLELTERSSADVIAVVPIEMNSTTQPLCSEICEPYYVRCLRTMKYMEHLYPVQQNFSCWSFLRSCPFSSTFCSFGPDMGGTFFIRSVFFFFFFGLSLKLQEKKALETFRCNFSKVLSEMSPYQSVKIVQLAKRSV